MRQRDLRPDRDPKFEDRDRTVRVRGLEKKTDRDLPDPDHFAVHGRFTSRQRRPNEFDPQRGRVRRRPRHGMIPARGGGTMRRLLRWTFHALAAVSLLLCVAAAGLWIRSYFVSDRLEWTTLLAGADGAVLSTRQFCLHSTGGWWSEV